MTAKLPVVYVNHYKNGLFYSDQFGFKSVPVLKLGATSSDVLDCVTYMLLITE